MNGSNHSFSRWLVRWGILALGVAMAAGIVPGIEYDSVGTLVVVALLLSFFNAIIRPILVLFTLPFILLTLGVGVLVINALLFMAVGGLVGGFSVAGFWSALGGSVIVSITNFLLGRLVGEPSAVQATVINPAERMPPRRGGRRIQEDNVIDV